MKDLVDIFKSKHIKKEYDIEHNEKEFHNQKLCSKANNSWDIIDTADNEVTTINDIPDNVISIIGYKASKEQRQKWARLTRNHKREVA